MYFCCMTIGIQNTNTYNYENKHQTFGLHFYVFWIRSLSCYLYQSSNWKEVDKHDQQYALNRRDKERG